MARYDIVINGYIGTNQIIKVQNIPQAGRTELVQNSDNTMQYIGGNAVNIAYCLAKLGVPALHIMRGGWDFDQVGFRRFLEEGGVSLEALTIVEEAATPICYLIEDAEKNHLTLYYTGSMDGRYAPKALPDPYFAGVRLALMVVGAYEDNLLFLQKVREKQIPLVFGMRADFNAFPKELLWEVLMESAIIFTNEVERQIIEELYGLDSITHFMKEGKASIVVTTLGKAGSVVYWKEQGVIKSETVPVTPSGEVVDATGAGDSYIAGFLYGYLKGADPVTCAAYGSTESSFIIEKVGCLSNVPTEAEMLGRNTTRA